MFVCVSLCIRVCVCMYMQAFYVNNVRFLSLMYFNHFRYKYHCGCHNQETFLQDFVEILEEMFPRYLMQLVAHV